VSNVLAWIKSNLAIVIFLVVMIAPLVAMPLVAGRLNSDVLEKAKERAKKDSEMQSLQDTKVEVTEGAPPTSVLVNQKLLDDYAEAVKRRKQDADTLYSRAIEHNRKGRDVLMQNVFPEMPSRRAEILPRQFFDALQDEYDGLLRDIGAGGPPDPNEVVSMLRSQERQFMTNMLAMDAVEDLSPEQEAELQQHLRGVRVGEYVRRALELSVYADKDAFDIPVWDQSDSPSPAELYGWQWDFWMYDDFLRGLAEANADAASVDQAPVKRILAATIDWIDLEGGGASAAPPGMGGGGRGAKASQAKPLNPTIEAALEYGSTITGRVTNPLYDVRHIQASLIVDPTRLPEILDALARRNFITVVDLRLTETDPYEAMKEGYYYGAGSLARLDLTVELIWLRAWTTPFMPGSVRDTLRIPPDQPAASAGDKKS
jgi:hypothetical protein